MGFESCHPAVNFIYFAAVLTTALLFRHPVFLILSFLCGCAYSVKRNGRKMLTFSFGMLLLVVIFALYYSSYTHFGVTVLWQNMVGNNMTVESFIYGLVLGGSFATTCLWISCLFSVFTTDKVVYLLGCISPRLSMYVSILLRMIPRMANEARRMNTARQGIGKGVNQGSLLQRMRNGFCILSMLITWLIESLAGVSESMRSRGSSLRGRTAFSIYRFDNRDRAYVVVMFICLTLTMMAVILGQTDMVYAPKVIWKDISALFCVGYGMFCLMPLILELWTEYRYKKQCEKMYVS